MTTTKQGGHGPALLGEHLRRLETEPTVNHGNDTVVAIIHIPPDQAGRDLAKDVGQKENARKNTLERCPIRDQQGDTQRERRLMNAETRITSRLLKSALWKMGSLSART